jgi:hypothetical protein
VHQQPVDCGLTLIRTSAIGSPEWQLSSAPVSLRRAPNAAPIRVRLGAVSLISAGAEVPGRQFALVTAVWLVEYGSVGERGDKALTYIPAITGELLLGAEA